MFKQLADESGNAAWARFTKIAREAQVKQGVADLWVYFKERLNHNSRLWYRAELSDENPFSAWQG